MMTETGGNWLYGPHRQEAAINAADELPFSFPSLWYPSQGDGGSPHLTEPHQDPSLYIGPQVCLSGE